MPYKPVILVIMDGFGVSAEARGNAVAAAEMPNLRRISRSHPGTALQAAGIAVGVPWGEVGSSEVGHLNIGAGQVIYQIYPRISLAIQNGSFFKIPVWREAIAHAKKYKSNIHLMGLLSVGGIHAHVDHLQALLKTFTDLKNKTFVHIFTDGEDSPPKSALRLLEKIPEAKIASVIGRKYALDRNQNWDLTAAAYKTIVDWVGEKAPDAKTAIENAYNKGEEDESIPPTAITGADGQPMATVKENDVLIFFNFRPDRARQLTEFFLPWPNLFFATMTQYKEGYNCRVAFPPQNIEYPLSRVIAETGKNQLKIAESEKRAHITYFLSGGNETPYKNEDRFIVPSSGGPYNQNPEMSAYQITELLLNQLDQKRHDFAAVNFANGDMLGHTGDFNAAIKALKTIDNCIGQIYQKIVRLNGAMVITADHGNVEEMINLGTGEIDKEHSTNPVPCWIAIPQLEKFQNDVKTAAITPGGVLADVTPTILDLMELPKPAMMDGTSLANLKTKLII